MIHIPPILSDRRKQALIDLCFPAACLFCRTPLTPDDDALCPACQAAAPWTDDLDCRRSGVSFACCLSPLFYTEDWKSAFHRYKFQGCWHYSRYFGAWMSHCLMEREPDFSRFDLITWAPLNCLRRLRRGYDQAERLAREVSLAAGLPLQRTLVKWKAIAPQSGTESADLRRSNVKNVYRLHPNAEVAGKRILLVDDIITTGSTLEEAAGVLREAGAREVCCLTLARSAKSL